MNPKKLDSNKNILNISLFLAPIDFITPISLILSRTEVTIVLAVFTALTATDIQYILV
jgi:hypothetical protein